MATFQQDFINIIKNSHTKYINSIEQIFNNSEQLMLNLTIDDAENLIGYIKEYNNLINSICLVINKINNIKKVKNVQEKIDKELMTKILPIMSVYRTLLLEKYKNELNNLDESNESNINELN